VRRSAAVLERILLVISAGLILLAILGWPPGGLMFALPYLFLMPWVVFALIGGGLAWWGRRALRSGPSQ